MISLDSLKVDAILVAFAGLFGTSVGFIMRHFFEAKPKPINEDTSDNLPKEILFNSGIVAIIWPEDDDGENIDNYQLIGEEKHISALLTATYGEKSAILVNLTKDDKTLANYISALRKDGKAFDWVSKGIEIYGYTFGAHACLTLRAASPNIGMRGTSAMRIPIWKTDHNGYLSWGNEAFLKSVEAKDLDTAIEENMLIDQKSAIEIKAALRGETIIDTRAVIIDGQRRNMRIYTSPAFDGTIGMAFDISEEINAQEILKREAKAHVETLNHLNDAVAVFDGNRHLSTYNSAFAKLWGLDPSWLDERPLIDELYSRLRAKSWLPLQRNFNEWRDTQLSFFKATGNIADETWTLPNSQILRVARQRQPNGGLLILFEDISDTTSLQAQFKTQIEVSTATIDKLQEGVAVFSSSGRMTLANAAFTNIWDLDSDFAKPHPEFMDFSNRAQKLYPDDDFWNELFARICDPTPTGRSETNGQISLRNQTRLSWLTRPLPDGATMVAFADITAQEQFQEVLREKAIALGEADKLKTEFLEKVSYQLRTPLTTITGYADILLTGIGGELSPIQSEYLAAVKQAGEQLNRMVTDLLDLATIDAGQSILELDDVDLHDVLEQAQEIALSKLSHSQFHIIIDEDTGGIIRADDKKIRQIMFNLIHNAMRNLKAGDTIHIGAKRILNNIRLYVTAPNLNMDALSAPKEYEAFSEGSRNVGLGLVLVKKFVEMHGGWLSMGSKDKLNLTITCHLPVAAKMNDAVPELEL